MREPSAHSQVKEVFTNLPCLRSYAEAASDYYIVKPQSTFQLADSDEYIRWRTSWGAAPSSCNVKSTIGHLSPLYGIDDSTSWSPSCWNLECPAVGEGHGPVSAPFQPAKTAFVPYAGAPSSVCEAANKMYSYASTSGEEIDYKDSSCGLARWRGCESEVPASVFEPCSASPL